MISSLNIHDALVVFVKNPSLFIVETIAYIKKKSKYHSI